MSVPRRFRLLPDGPLGWTPYAWLVYILTFLVEPVLRIGNGTASAGYVAAMAIGLVVFLAAYFRGYWVRGRQLVPIIVLIAGMAVAYSPFNGGAAVLFVYAGSFAGYLQPQRRALWALGLIVLSALATAFVVDAALWYWITAIPVTVIVGGVNLHFAQVGQAHQRLRLAQEEVEHLAAVAERERIARDLHDVLGHTLSMIVLKAELAAKLAERDPARAAVEMRDVESAARRTLQEVREAIRGYHPTMGDEVRRAGAILKAAGIQTTFEFENVTLPQPIEETLALGLREAVTNVVRHSGAGRCRVRLVPQASGVLLEVSDDGRAGRAPEGAGLRGMRERVESCGGTLERRTDDGTQLRLLIPLGPAARVARDLARNAS